MIDFDSFGFEALVHHYSMTEGIINPQTWEKIICKSVGGNWIPGDIYMADGYKSNFGLNIKSIKKQFAKRDLQTIDIIQCRTPIANDRNLSDEILSEKIINTLVEKRKSSFEKFDLDIMLDVDIIHNRNEDKYSVRVFIENQPNYEEYDFFWKNGAAYFNGEKSWKLKRNYGDQNSYQNCLYIKKLHNVNNSIVNFSIESPDNYEITIEDAKIKYQNFKLK